MKNCLKIVLFQIIVMFLLIGSAYAADNPCKISLSTSKTTLKPGDEIVVNISMSDITLSEGINNITAILEYSDNVFQIIYDESEEAEEQVVLYSESLETDGNVAMLYLGENDTSSTKSDWNALLYEDPTGQKGIMLYTGDKQKTSQNVAKIRLKVKNDAPKTNTKISLESIVAYDANNTDQKVNDTSISFTIDGVEQVGSQKPANNISNNVTNNAGNNVSNNIQNENLNNDISQNDAPNTGIEDYAPAFFVILIIALFSFINYRKYKDIY